MGKFIRFNDQHKSHFESAHVPIYDTHSLYRFIVFLINFLAFGHTSPDLHIAWAGWELFVGKLPMLSDDLVILPLSIWEKGTYT